VHHRIEAARTRHFQAGLQLAFNPDVRTTGACRDALRQDLTRSRGAEGDRCRTLRQIESDGAELLLEIDRGLFPDPYFDEHGPMNMVR